MALLAIRSGSEAISPLVFFVLVTTIFSLGFAHDTSTLSQFGVVVIWAVVLFSILLTQEGVFRRDRDDGSLELLVLYARPLFAAVLGKLIVQWCISGLPIVALVPFAAWMMNIEWKTIPVLMGTLVIGTPVFSLIGALGASLILSTNRGGILLTLLVMPMFIPVLLLGIGVCYAHSAGEPFIAPFFCLLAILMGTVTLVPFAIGFALKASQKY